jgi:hypothetical protein
MPAPYFCWVKDGGEPRVPHKTLIEAQTEARRLQTMIAKGRHVHILESIEVLDPIERPPPVITVKRKRVLEQSAGT